MEGVITVLVVLNVILVIWNISENDKYCRFISISLLMIAVIILDSLVLSYKNRNTPTAMDVYQGKTILEITYRDKVPIDTIIVFKDEFKKEMEE